MQRVLLGAPNEARFGFAQAVAVGGRCAIAGQVGKDNRTGAMVDDHDLVLQLRRALDNVAESAAAASPANVVTALRVHAAVDLDVLLPVLAEALRDAGDPPPAAVVVRVPALSHDAYLVEISATAHDRSLMDITRLPAADAAPLPWAPAAVLAGPDIVLSACHGRGPDLGAALAAALGEAAERLGRCGASLADVVEEHLYVVGPADAEAFAALCDAHRSAYAAGAPASTLVLVDALADGADVAVSIRAHRATVPQ